MQPFIFINSKPKKKFSFFSALGIVLIFLFASCKKPDQLIASNTVDGSVNSSAIVTKPNIILILGDDVGYEIPAVDGGQSYSTPNIDQLAKRGVRFTQGFASADCSPSRFMLLTGKYNFRNYTEWGVMDRSQRTIGNMLHDAGYATCYVGKWQLDGGDTSIRTFGFDNYSVWLPYKLDPEESGGSRYKSPPIYEAAAFLPKAQTKDKYSIDMFTNYALQFIDSNKQKPFFLYYSLTLTHKPFTPTPNDPRFSTWNFRISDTQFFPEMVSYMDNQINLLNAKIRSLNLQNNTVIIYIGDNGSPKNIYSKYNGIIVPGEKGKTTTYGTHVPMIFYWPGHFPVHVTDQLADFTDFMPTLANIAGIPVPTNYGILDGQTFYPVLNGADSSTRNYVFNHFEPQLSDSGHGRLIRYAQNKMYKYYESGNFYDIVSDIEEKNPIPDDQLTPEELQAKQYFQSILAQMHN